MSKMYRFIGFFVLFCAHQWVNCDVSEEGDLFEGDMELTEEQKINIQMSIDGVPTYGATRYRNWPRNIPYKINSALGSYGESKILEAIRDYQRYTCLRFHQRKNEAGYLYFTTGKGCSSPVGYRGKPNTIRLARGCLHKGIIIHEIMHSLGFFHEQSRPDRDNHVQIIWANIPKDKKNNFKKYGYGTIKSGNSPYDYLSVMHYGRSAFGGGKVTIDAKDNRYDRAIGQRRGFSNEDVKQIKAKYRC